MREIKLANSLGATKNLRHFKILLSTDKLIKLNEMIFKNLISQSKRIPNFKA